jgi:hypothetical protein
MPSQDNTAVGDRKVLPDDPRNVEHYAAIGRYTGRIARAYLIFRYESR